LAGEADASALELSSDASETSYGRLFF